MSGDWQRTLWTLLVTFCNFVTIRCTENFWSPCLPAQRVRRWPQVYLTIIWESLFWAGEGRRGQARAGVTANCDTHPAYDPLHFPFLFSQGELDLNSAVRCQGHVTNHKNNRVSCREFVAYRLFIRADWYSFLHRTARSLLRQISTPSAEMSVPSLPGSPGTSRLIVFYN
jgi:hypothetical protein